MSLFHDERNKLSSTRVFGATCVIVGLVLACCKMLKEGQACIGAGVTLLSAGQGKSALVSIGKSLDKKTVGGIENEKVITKVQEDI